MGDERNGDLATRRPTPTMIADKAERLRSLLSSSGAALDDGLGRDEIEEIEGRLGFQFGPDHRDLLTFVLPVGSDGSIGGTARRASFGVDSNGRWTV